MNNKSIITLVVLGNVYFILRHCMGYSIPGILSYTLALLLIGQQTYQQATTILEKDSNSAALIYQQQVDKLTNCKCDECSQIVAQIGQYIVQKFIETISLKCYVKSTINFTIGYIITSTLTCCLKCWCMQVFTFNLLMGLAFIYVKNPQQCNDRINNICGIMNQLWEQNVQKIKYQKI